jgi:hypothetical protein
MASGFERELVTFGGGAAPSNVQWNVSIRRFLLTTCVSWHVIG